MKKLLLVFTLLIIAISLAACNQNTTISFSDNKVFVTVGDYLEIPINHENINKDEIKYSFSNLEYVEYENGLFHFLKPGEIVITAYWEKNKSIYDTINIVIDDLDRKITLNNNSYTLTINDTKSIDLSLKNLTLSDLNYDIEDSSIIDINQGWQIIGKNSGTTIVTIYYINNPEVSVQINVIVEEKKSISFDVDNIEIDIKENLNLPIKLSNILLDNVIFSFDKPGIIKIENNKIIPLNTGSVILTATYISNPAIFSKLNITVTNNSPIYTTDDYQYWILNLNPKYNANEVILTRSEIEEFNNTILSNYTNTKVLDIFNQPKTLTKNQVEVLINNYSLINKYTVYSNLTGNTATQQDKDNILANRNLSNIPSLVTVRYGIVTDFASLRSYPTNFYSQTNELDRFQETGLNVGEGVLVYHTSLDGNWYFVQAQNYNGWVESKNIAICSYEEMDNFLNTNDFIIVTADMLQINSVWVRMGQRIPYTSKTNDSYKISFPTRDSNGNLLLKEINLSTYLDVSDGYLDYTLENVFKQGFKMLGIPYSWGDKYVEGRDCSSTQNAIYATFGFKMPRNTSNQSKIPNYSDSGKYTLNQIKANYMPGTLLFSSGHVLMYIGDDINGNPYVLHNTNAAVAGCKVQSLSSYGINNIIATSIFYNK